jgi:phosphoserine aminotransferase
MARALNFNAGPATLPLPALERAQSEFLDFASTGMSVMEHSHRGKEYEAVHKEAIALVREIYGVPDDMDVLLLQGGASQMFATVPLNFLSSGQSAEYVVTGAWGEKAFGEAKVVAQMFGAEARMAATSAAGEGKEKQYTRTPDPSAIKLGAKPAYLHVTSNETIHGVQWPEPDFPSKIVEAAGGAPVVVDMSSDFGWRKMDLSRFGLVYAGAQKNIGPSGVVLAIAKKDLVAKGRKDIPKIFQYRTHAENDSLYNTPPTFGIYLVRNVLAHVKSIGGLVAVEKINREKAKLLYETIDAHAGFFRCPVEKAYRSTMNVVFRLPSEQLEEAFVSEAKKQKMVGLKGHRSVGGIRVSIYNAVPLEWVKTLTDFMKDFCKRNG